MTILHASLYTVLERFPDLRHAIKTRFKTNEMFKTICEDYQICLKTMRHWEQADGEDAIKRQLEYWALLKELEEEILQSLDETVA